MLYIDATAVYMQRERETDEEDAHLHVYQQPGYLQVESRTTTIESQLELYN